MERQCTAGAQNSNRSVCEDGDKERRQDAPIVRERPTITKPMQRRYAPNASHSPGIHRMDADTI
jgi:hypothetical protein